MSVSCPSATVVAGAQGAGFCDTPTKLLHAHAAILMMFDYEKKWRRNGRRNRQMAEANGSSSENVRATRSITLDREI